ncbi:MAG: type II toxin-antitoxin system RelE/ParE family toxin [Comamonadaceae bacterium]|nr:type II toxin-antitoxin system RelE/ParE family toxin [Comamonadaceae bacterium]
MTAVRFTRPALADLLVQVRYYEAIRDGLGARFHHEIEVAAEHAAAFPQHGKPGPAGTRSRHLSGFLLKLVYTWQDGDVVVHAVAGDRQLPGHWIGRLPRG